jgi:hypothetical protein
MASRTMESNFSRKTRVAMRQLGVASVKTNDQRTRGIPDIYFAGGGWAESKIIPGLPVTYNPPLKYFSALQRSFLDSYTDQGDKCFANVLWEMGNRNRIYLFMPWWYFRRIRFWDMDTAVHFGKGVSDTWDLNLERFFRQGKWDPTIWWDRVWSEWPHKDNAHRFNKLKRVEPTLEDLMKEADVEDI